MEKIKIEKFYTPREIFELGVITNRKGKPDYSLILRLIKAGKLRAKNFGCGKKPQYRVKGSDLIKFLS